MTKKQRRTRQLRMTRQRNERRVIDRYHVLVNRKFDAGLTEEEEAEMERLGRKMDRYNAPFYRPILKRLRRLVAKVRGADGEATE